MKLILATKNPGKIQEIKNVLAGLDVELIPMKDAGFTEDIVEDGQSLEENAIKKARVVSEFTHEWTVADDAGIFIDAVNGEPGINTENWSSQGASARELIDFTLEKLKDIPEEKRGAYLETTVALYRPNGIFRTFTGKVSGRLLFEPRGEMIESQPFSLLFVPQGYTQSMAEMSVGERNSISHRGMAFRKVKTFLKNEVLKGGK